MSMICAWQPIETAPKDGRIVLLYRDMSPWDVVGYGWWAAPHSRLDISGWISHGFSETPGNLGLAHPTHWLPLPEPPQASDAVARAEGTSTSGPRASHSEALSDLEAQVARVTAERDEQLRLKNQTLDELARIRSLQTTWDEGHEAGYRSAEFNWKAKLEAAEAALAKVTAERDEVAEERDDYRRALDFANLADQAALANMTAEMCSSTADQRTAQLPAAEAALSAVSGALMDAGDIPVPGDEARYGDAVRLLTSDRDALRTALSAHREALEKMKKDICAYVDTLPSDQVMVIGRLLRWADALAALSGE